MVNLPFGAKAQDVPLIKKGQGSAALRYSVHNDVIAIATCFGKEMKDEKRNRILDYIVNNIFTGETEAKIVFFNELEIEGDGFLCTVFIQGDKQKHPETKDYILNLTQLQERASKLVGVHRLLSGFYKDD